MGAIVLDSSIVIALFDPADAHHQASTAVILAARRDEETMVLPASVLSEVMVAAYRQGADTVGARLQDLHDTFGRPRAMDADVAIKAAELRARHRGLRLPDALVLATADVDGADRVLTADKGWSSVDRRVEVVGQ
jgi:PIN domain nuclease of toxin-antitoxin system